MAQDGGMGARAGHTGQNRNENLLQREDNRANRSNVRLEVHQGGTALPIEFRRKPDADRLLALMLHCLPRFRSLGGFPPSLLIPALSWAYVDHPGTFR